eukprot:2299144-Pleurochrysis_carterae.AAC.2
MGAHILLNGVRLGTAVSQFARYTFELNAAAHQLVFAPRIDRGRGRGDGGGSGGDGEHGRHGTGKGIGEDETDERHGDGRGDSGVDSGGESVLDRGCGRSVLLSQDGEATNRLELVFDPAIDVGGRFMACTGGWDWAPYSHTTLDGAHTMSKGVWKSVYIAYSEPVPHALVTGTHAREELVFGRGSVHDADETAANGFRDNAVGDGVDDGELRTFEAFFSEGKSDEVREWRSASVSASLPGGSGFLCTPSITYIVPQPRYLGTYPNTPLVDGDHAGFVLDVRVHLSLPTLPRNVAEPALGAKSATSKGAGGAPASDAV